MSSAPVTVCPFPNHIHFSRINLFNIWQGRAIDQNQETEKAGTLAACRLSKAPQNKVTISQARHSRMLLAGIQKKSLDARLRGHDGRYWTPISVELYLERETSRFRKVIKVLWKFFVIACKSSGDRDGFGVLPMVMFNSWSLNQLGASEHRILWYWARGQPSSRLYKTN